MFSFITHQVKRGYYWLILRGKPLFALILTLFFSALTASSSFAQVPGGDKVKELGDKGVNFIFNYAMIGLAILLMVFIIWGGVEIALSSIRPDLRKKGFSKIAWAGAGMALVSLTWVIGPGIGEIIAGFTEQEISLPTKK
jgi:hypothetical protein